MANDREAAISRLLKRVDGTYPDGEVREHWVQDTHQVEWTLRPGSRVIDLGAQIGVFSLFCASRGAKVLAVEPLSANVNRLRSNIAATGLSVDVLHAAAGPRASSVDVYGQTVLFGPGILPCSETVRAYTLSELVAMMPGGEADILKVDIEGAEYALFNNASEEALRRIAYVTMEIHSWDGVISAPHTALESDDMGPTTHMELRRRMLYNISRTHVVYQPPVDFGGTIFAYRHGTPCPEGHRKRLQDCRYSVR